MTEQLGHRNACGGKRPSARLWEWRGPRPRHSQVASWICALWPGRCRPYL